MRYIVLLLCLGLTGCFQTAVPVKAKFPEAPGMLLEPCVELKRLEKDPKLSDVAKTVTENYTIYHDCALKNRAWGEWYKAQKKIFEDVK
jgi:hypothetical protein